MGSFSVFDIVLLSVNGRKQSTSDFAMSIIVAVGFFFNSFFFFFLKWLISTVLLFLLINIKFWIIHSCCFARLAIKVGGAAAIFPFVKGRCHLKQSLPFITVVAISIHAGSDKNAGVHENRWITYFRITFSCPLSSDIRSIDSKNGGRTTTWCGRLRHKK